MGNNIAFVIGHDKTSPGAYSPFLGMSEYLYNSEVASYLHQFDVYKRPIGGGYNSQMKKLAEQLNAKNYDLVVELHFNGFDNESNGKGVGTEAVIFKGNETTKRLGARYCEIISKAYKTTNRGVKEVSKDGERGYGFLSMMNANAIIVEPFFCDEEESLRFKHPGIYAEHLIKWLCS